ncbi:MAG: cobalt transporter CbiM, partial [Deltaproteobacteria bacterium]|nr:cobalt transporter CbiM [Deltaproteobacteria bacterium]
MHISEGVLSAPVLISGVVLAGTGLAIGLKKMEYDRVPEVALLAAAFFVASLIRIPLGPSSCHLALSGAIGVLLGWSVFPAIVVGLTLQALLFQFGGLTTLGVNTVIMALPALVCCFLFNGLCRSSCSALASAASFACGFLSIALGTLLMALALVTTGKHFSEIAVSIIIAHLPL